MFGLSDDEIEALLRGEFEKFPAPDQVLLRMADALADTPANVSDKLYAELRKHFSEEELIEFAADAGQENFRARANRLFDVGSDNLCCTIPGR
jgi:alkylhydroperoxidase family enzyme